MEERQHDGVRRVLAAWRAYHSARRTGAPVAQVAELYLRAVATVRDAVAFRFAQRRSIR